jgi:hypothetical protein
MDLEVSRDGLAVTAAAEKTIAILGADLTIQHTLAMCAICEYHSSCLALLIVHVHRPGRMNFRDEGGASLHPNGLTVVTVGTWLP